MAISMLRIAAVPLLASVLGIGSAAAATINYSEAVDGQLSAFPLSLGVAGIGTNTVAGSLAGTCVPSDCNANPGGSSGNSQDSFKIQILAGTSLASVFVTTSNVIGPNGFSATFDQSPGSILASLPLGSTSANLLSSALGAGHLYRQRVRRRGKLLWPVLAGLFGGLQRGPDPCRRLAVWRRTRADGLAQAPACGELIPIS